MMFPVIWQLRLKSSDALVMIEQLVDWMVIGMLIWKYPPLLKLSIGRLGTKLMLYAVDFPVVAIVGSTNRLLEEEVGAERL